MNGNQDTKREKNNMTILEELMRAVLSATEEQRSAALRVLRGEAEVGKRTEFRMAEALETLKECARVLGGSSRMEGVGRDQVKTGFVDKRTAARYCALSQRTLDYARERGDLPYHKVHRKVLFKMADLDAYMAQTRVAV